MLSQPQKKNAGRHYHHSPADACQSREEPRDQSDCKRYANPTAFREVRCAGQWLGASNEPHRGDQKDHTKHDRQGPGTDPMHHRCSENRAKNSTDANGYANPHIYLA